ncbi:MAG: ABC transporter substrate-binding protein, partial [Anaerolineae bacterium]
EHDAALAMALRLLSHDPLREDAHRLVMRAYCHLGQRNAALEQYHRCREIVLEELRTEPMVETTELYRAILEGRIDIGRVPPAPIPMVEPSTPSGRSPLDVIPPVKLAGREQEMAFLQQCWQRTQAGHGGLVLISGEAGVGKTRLVEEFANRLRWQGVRVLWGRCYEFERTLPYQSLAEALRTVVSALTPDELADFPTWAVAEVARLVPEVLERHPGPEVSAAPSPDQEQSRLFEGLARFLAELSSHGPLLVVLEDLHWASESTLELLHYSTRHLANHPVMIAGTFRPEAIGLQHPLLAMRRRLTREGLAKPLRLSRLPPAAVEVIVMEMSGAGEAVVPVAQRLYQETEGNPFFLVEIIKTLFETGVVRLEEQVWRGDFGRISEGEIPLPASVSEAIQARTHRLDEDVQDALRLTAVLGREFDFDLLNAIWGRGEQVTLQALDALLRHRLIDEGTGVMGRDYAFTHHKIQEAIYAVIPRRHRQHAHGRAGAAMETLYGPEAEALAGELAFHFEQGQQLDKTLTKKAITYLLVAGDQARLLYAHEEAVGFYQRALALLKEQGEYERAARTLMKLGLTYHNAFDFKAARQAYDEGFALWQRAAQMEPVVPAPPASHAIREAMPEPLTLDPARFEGGFVSLNLFSGLMELTSATDVAPDVVPDVARGWEVSEGGRKYIFHLRDDVRWSDGTPVTAGDFEYAWKRMLDPATGSPNASLLYDIKGARAFHQGEVSDSDRVGVRALDELTLIVELEEPTAYFLHLVAHSVTWPVPRHVIAVHGEAWAEGGNIVTNGAFRLEAWQRGQSMILARNPEYHGRFMGNVQQVEVRFVPWRDWSTRLEMYEADDLAVASVATFPPVERDRARQRHAGEYVPVVGSPGTLCIIFEGRRPPFDDPRMRRAFALATDREMLADVVEKGLSLPATGGFVPPGMPGHSAGIGLPYDPDRARHLLAEAGYPGGRGFPVVDVLTPPVIEPVVEYLQRQWRENLGVEATCEAMEPANYPDRLERKPPHLYCSRWGGDYPDPDSFLRVAVRSMIGLSWWQNEAYDALVEEARRVMDQEERIKLYRQADRILVEEVPIMPLVYHWWADLVKPWVKLGGMTMLYKDIIIEPH